MRTLPAQRHEISILRKRDQLYDSEKINIDSKTRIKLYFESPRVALKPPKNTSFACQLADKEKYFSFLH